MSTIDPAQLVPFDIAGTAKALGVSSDVVRSLVRSGELRAFDAAYGRGKARWRITAAAILDFQTRRSNQPQVSKPPRRKRRNPTAEEYV